MNGRKGNTRVKEKAAENCIKQGTPGDSSVYRTVYEHVTCQQTTHYHGKGCSVNFEHFSTDVKLTTFTKAAPSVSILSADSPPAAHELTFIRLQVRRGNQDIYIYVPFQLQLCFTSDFGKVHVVVTNRWKDLSPLQYQQSSCCLLARLHNTK